MLLKNIITSAPAAKFVAVASAILTATSTVLASGMIVYGGYVLAETVYTEQSAYATYDMLQYKPLPTEEEAPDFSDILELNDDTVAWITLTDTHIDYPVMQGKDDLEYAGKDVYGNASLTGAIYLKTENTSNFSDPYSVIFGHHMDSGGMFGDLKRFKEKDFFDSHQYGVLTTPAGEYTLNIFAAIETDAYDRMVYERVSERSEDDVDALIEYIRSNAIQYDESRRTGVRHIIALSTCSSSATYGRDVIFAELSPGLEDIPEGELPLTDPGGRKAKGHGKTDEWALLNLITMIVTIILVVPVHILRSKFRRKKMMQAVLDEHFVPDDPEGISEGSEEQLKTEMITESKDESEKQLKKFVKRFRIGFAAEVILAIISIILFVLTEDIRLPVAIVDEWTIWMILLLIAVWLTDLFMIRLRELKHMSGEKTRQEEEEGNHIA